MNTTYTVSEAAQGTGKSPWAVRRALAGVAPAGRGLVAGNETQLFDISNLPEDLRDKLDPYNLAALAELVRSWGDPQPVPNDVQVARLLECAFCKLEELVQAGACERIMKARQIRWLARTVRVLARNEAALRRNFNRYLARWRNGGRRFSTLLFQYDKAAKERRAPALPKQDLDLLVGTAITGKDCSLRSAWIACWPQLTEKTRARYPLRWEVPKNVRRQCMPIIRRLKPQHIGKRSARLNGAYLTRDYSNLFAADVTSQDDKTVDAYSFPKNDPKELHRPQVLLQIDVKSGLVINAALEFDRSWTAVTALELVRRKVVEIGISNLGEHWERGKFKDAKILGYGGLASIFNDERETFADRLGIKIKHALPGNARAKVIERVIGEIAKLEARLPGYIGRDEMHTKYEDVQRAAADVRAGRVHPAEAGFLSDEEMKAAYEKLITAYNNTVRDSKVAGERGTPEELWEKLQRRDASGKVVGLTRLPKELEYLLRFVDTVKVTRAGIRLFSGKYRYCSEETGKIEREWCKVYFDPNRPESIAITDLDGNNVRTIPLLPKPDAWNGGEVLAEASAAVAAHNGAIRRAYLELKHNYVPPARLIFVDPETLQRGREINQGQEALEIQAKRDKRHETAEEAEETRRRLALADQWEREHRLEIG